MPPIEVSIYIGASFAKWQRLYGSCSLPEILQKIRQRISSRIFLWYRSALALAFRLRNLLTRNAPLTAHARGVAFEILPEGAIAFHAWSTLRFEQAELEFILRVLRPGMTFFDVGANVGIFSLAAGQKLRRKTGLIFAFEPCPATFSILEKNLALNHLAEVRTVRAAVSDQTGEALLFVNARFKDGLNSLQDPSHSDAEVVGREPVPTVTLDDFIARSSIPRVDVMKVDVEGAELLVFRGASQLLKRSDAPLILYEGYSWCAAGFHYHPVELMWLLASFGYELFVLDAETGRVRKRRPGESYDAMMVAVKPAHASFSEIARNAGEA
jgi:FkbM family methyltransferase